MHQMVADPNSSLRLHRVEPCEHEYLTAILPMRRSDDMDLSERASRELCKLGHRSLQGIDVSVHAGIISLNGHVPTYFLRHLAEDIAASIPGVRDVENRLVVCRPKSCGCRLLTPGKT